MVENTVINKPVGFNGLVYDVWIVFLEETVPFNSNYKSLPSSNSENDVFKSNTMKWHSQCSWLATNFKAIIFSIFFWFWDPSSIVKDNGFCLDLFNWKLLVAALATKPVNIAGLLAVNFTKNILYEIGKVIGNAPAKMEKYISPTPTPR